MKRGTFHKEDLVKLLIGLAMLFQKIRARLWAVKLGDFVPMGYTGLTTFYLFKCERCKRLSADYLHGYGDGIFSDGDLDCYRCN